MAEPETPKTTPEAPKPLKTSAQQFSEATDKLVPQGVKGAAKELTNNAAEGLTKLGLDANTSRGWIPAAGAVMTAGVGLAFLPSLNKMGEGLGKGLRFVLTGGGLLEKIPVIGGLFTAVGEAVNTVVSSLFGAAAAGLAALGVYKALETEQAVLPPGHNRTSLSNTSPNRPDGYGSGFIAGNRDSFNLGPAKNFEVAARNLEALNDPNAKLASASQKRLLKNLVGNEIYDLHKAKIDILNEAQANNLIEQGKLGKPGVSARVANWFARSAPYKWVATPPEKLGNYEFAGDRVTDILNEFKPAETPRANEGASKISPDGKTNPRSGEDVFRAGNEQLSRKSAATEATTPSPEPTPSKKESRFSNVKLARGFGAWALLESGGQICQAAYVGDSDYHRVQAGDVIMKDEKKGLTWQVESEIDIKLQSLACQAFTSTGLGKVLRCQIRDAEGNFQGTKDVLVLNKSRVHTPGNLATAVGGGKMVLEPKGKGGGRFLLAGYILTEGADITQDMMNQEYGKGLTKVAGAGANISAWVWGGPVGLLSGTVSGLYVEKLAKGELPSTSEVLWNTTPGHATNTVIQIGKDGKQLVEDTYGLVKEARQFSAENERLFGKKKAQFYSKDAAGNLVADTQHAGGYTPSRNMVEYYGQLGALVVQMQIEGYLQDENGKGFTTDAIKKAFEARIQDLDLANNYYQYAYYRDKAKDINSDKNFCMSQQEYYLNLMGYPPSKFRDGIPDEREERLKLLIKRGAHDHSSGRANVEDLKTGLFHLTKLEADLKVWEQEQNKKLDELKDYLEKPQPVLAMEQVRQMYLEYLSKGMSGNFDRAQLQQDLIHNVSQIVFSKGNAREWLDGKNANELDLLNRMLPEPVEAAKKQEALSLRKSTAMLEVDTGKLLSSPMTPPGKPSGAVAPELPA